MADSAFQGLDPVDSGDPFGGMDLEDAAQPATTAPAADSAFAQYGDAVDPNAAPTPPPAATEPSVPVGAQATTAAADAVTADAPMQEVTITAKRPQHGASGSFADETSARDTAAGVIPTWIAKGKMAVAGAQEYLATNQYKDAKLRMWQSMVLPDAVKEAKAAGNVAIYELPQVIEAAKHVGVRPDIFARDWQTYVDMSPEDQEKLYRDSVDKIQSGQDAAIAATAKREGAAKEEEFYRPKTDSGWSPKAIAFNALSGAPQLLAAVGVGAIAGPAAGAATFMATAAPESYAEARNQGADHDTASTYALLSSLAMAAPELPVLKIVGSGEAGKVILRKVVGDAFADSVPGNVVNTAAAQGVSQSVITALQIGIDHGVIGKDTSLKDALEEIGQAGLTGAVSGAPLGLLHGGHAPPSEEPKVNTATSGKPQPTESAQEEKEPGKIPDVSGIDPEVHVALKAMVDKTVSPAQVEKLEAAGLATRNDVGVPRLLPAGRRELMRLSQEPTPEQRAAAQSGIDKQLDQDKEKQAEEAIIAADADRQTNPDHPANRPGNNQVETGEKVPGEPEDTAPIGGLAPRPETLPLTERLKSDEQLRDTLTQMKNETGWLQEGGHVLMDEDHQVIGRTGWIPHHQWWADRPGGQGEAKSALTEEQVHAAVDKALAGKKLGSKQLATIEHMTAEADSRNLPAGQEEFNQELERARSETDTQPTDEQKASGDYKKGSLDFAGLPVRIESPINTIRRGTSAGGAKWERTMGRDYGYIDGTKSKDGDGVDVFLAGRPDTGHVYVINQKNPDGTFDETKSVLGAMSKEEAKAIYLSHYPKGWKGFGSIVDMPTHEFAKWAKSKAPLREAVERVPPRTSDMNEFQLRQALRSHELTSLPNRRAYNEDPKLPYQASLDVDSLKWINDNFGHDAGDSLLKHVAEVLREHVDNLYHISGDEFVAQGEDEAALHKQLQAAVEDLKTSRIHHEMADGRVARLEGMGLSYGVGKDLHEAEQHLHIAKSSREAEGVRAPRGEKPAGASVEDAGEREAREADVYEGLEDEPLLASQSEEELEARDRQNAAAEKATAAAIQKAKDRAAADTEAKDFRLSGSKAPADVAIGGGQRPMFSRKDRDPESPATGPFSHMTRAEFLGKPRITSKSNAVDLQPRAIKSVDSAPAESFLKGFTAKYSADGAAVFEGDKVVASYNFGDTLVVDPKYRRQGIGSELVYQWRTRYPDKAVTKYRTAATQKVQEQVWDRIMREGGKRVMFSRKDGATPAAALKTWFRNSKVVDKDGKPLRVYHGTSRMDRFGQGIKQGRATSGPMPFFTDDPAVAAGYAKGKQDTSLTGDEMHFSNWYTYKPEGGRSSVPLDRKWYSMSSSDQAHFNDMLRRIRLNEETSEPEDGGDRGGISPDTYDWELKQARGNGIKAAQELWLSSGSIFNEEHKYAKVMRMAGVDMRGVDYNDHKGNPGTVPVYLRIENPLNTADLMRKAGDKYEPTELGKKLIDAVSAVRHWGRKRGAEHSGDIWDKGNWDKATWLQQLKDSLSRGDTHVFTSIPDQVTKVLRSMGYDGLKDDGGKNGGDKHDVWVPFDAGQVKSAVGNRTFGENSNFMKSVGAGADTGLPHADLERVVRNTIRDSGMRAAPDFPHVHVHQDVSTLPPDLRARVEADGAEHTAGAVYDPRTGEIHMIADNLGTEAEARETLWHEAVGHHGLRLVMDADRYNTTMDGIWNAMPDRVRATAQRNGLDVSDLAQRRMASEEVVAYAAGKYLSGEKIDEPIQTIWNRAIRAIRQFFARITGKPFTDDRGIARLIGGSKRALETGATLQRTGAIAASTRSPTFYSAVERAVDGSKQAKASAEQWLATIRKTPGVKQEEMQWLGVEEWLKAHEGPVSKADLQDFIKTNQLHLEETVHGKADEDQSPNERKQTQLAEKLRAMGYQVRFNDLGELDEMQHPSSEEAGQIYDEGIYIFPHEPDAFDDMPDEHQQIAEELRATSMEVAKEHLAKMTDAPEGWDRVEPLSTRYEDYTLPGGTNYREMLIRKPLDASDTLKTVYKSSHFPERNVLAHVRFKDRTDADGKKVLFLEELQSDWHQAGRKRGYRDRSPEAKSAVDKHADAVRAYTRTVERLDHLKIEHEAGNATTEEVNQALRDLYDAAEVERDTGTEMQKFAGEVPDAPFKTTWPSLIMKRMIRHAAEGGYDRIAWTTGAQQAERYDLEKHIDSIQWRRNGNIDALPNGKFLLREPGLQEKMFDTREDARAAQRRYFLRVDDKEGNPIYNSNTDRAGLEDIIGHELAGKIVGANESHGRLEGLGLRTGGEGMRGFYDDILPRETSKLVGKFGGKVDDRDVHLDSRPHMVYEGPENTIDDVNHAYRGAQHDNAPVSVIAHLADIHGSMLGGMSFRDAAARHASLSAAERLGGTLRMEEPTTETAPSHGFDITPQLREAALSQGFPMYWKKPSQQDLDLQRGKGSGWYARVRKAVEYLAKNPITNEFRKVFNPVGMDEDSRRTARLATAALGNLSHNTYEVQNALEAFSRQVEKMRPEDQLEMMDAIEHGIRQPNAELQPIADKMRELLDANRDKVRALGEGYLDTFLENYFPHYWTDHDAAKKQMASIMGRRPLRGPASFLKMRTIPTIKEGLEHGLTPLTINPLVLTLLKTREMQRFVSGVTMMRELKEAHLAQFLRSGMPMPDGWKGIDDSIAKIKQWSEAEQGFIERGQYIMPENAARIINNHVGRSAISDNAVLNPIRLGTNLISTMQLGFSAFHLGFTTLDAMVSKNALAFSRLIHGEPLRAGAALLEGLTPVGAALNLKRGYDLMKAYSNPSGATPELLKLVSALEAGGGRAHMDRYYLAIQGANPFKGVGVSSIVGDVKTALQKGDVKGAAGAVARFPVELGIKQYRNLQEIVRTMPKLQIPFEIAGRLMRATSAPIMEYVVPMQKLGVFSDLAQDWLRRHPDATSDQLSQAMQSAWASVDNRLGEMVYDNLFWNRTLKDVAHLSVRAVGWNLGTYREIGGAPIDLLKAIDKLATTGKISADDLGHKIPYVLAMTATTALLGATVQYMFTGQGPQELKDYFFPRTGGTTNKGTPERISLPSYVKDIYEYSQHAGQTLANKANPIFGILHSIWTNQNFYGDPIADPEAPDYKQLQQKGAYAIHEMVPFSIQGSQNITGSGQPGPMGAAETGVKKVMPFFGLTPAPGYITSPDQLERRQRFEQEQKYSQDLRYQWKKAIQAKDVAKAADLKDQYTAARRRMQELQRGVQQDRVQAAKARHKQVTSIRSQGFPATAGLVQSMPLEPDQEAMKYFARIAGNG